MYSNLMTASNNSDITYWTMNLGQFIDQSFAGGIYIPTLPSFVVGPSETFTGNASESVLLKNTQPGMSSSGLISLAYTGFGEIKFNY